MAHCGGAVTQRGRIVVLVADEMGNKEIAQWLAVAPRIAALWRGRFLDPLYAGSANQRTRSRHLDRERLKVSVLGHQLQNRLQLSPVVEIGSDLVGRSGCFALQFW